MKLTVRELNEKTQKLLTVRDYLEAMVDEDPTSKGRATLLDAADLLDEYREKLLDTKIDI